MMGHMVLATKIPEFAMTEPEAAQLSVAVCNYLRHTNVRMTQKTQDLAALIMALFMIEGTRVIAAANSIKMQRRMMADQVARAGASGPVPATGGNVARFVPGSIPGVV